VSEYVFMLLYNGNPIGLFRNVRSAEQHWRKLYHFGDSYILRRDEEYLKFILEDSPVLEMFELVNKRTKLVDGTIEKWKVGGQDG
jgi:hypothetical protein